MKVPPFVHRLVAWILLSIVWGTSCPHITVAQESHQYLQIGFEPVTGEPRLIKVEMVRLAKPFDLDLQMLANDEIQRELEIIPSQSRKIQDLRSRFGEIYDKFSNGYMNNVDADLRTKLKDDYVQSVDEIKNEYSEVLLPHQQERLKELYNRTIYNQQGVQKFVEKYSADQGLNLSPKEVSDIEQMMLETERELFEQIVEAYRGFIEKLAKEIPAGEPFFQELATSASLVSIDVLFVDLPLIDELQIKNTESELRNRLAAYRGLRLDPVGNWEYMQLKSLGASAGIFMLARELENSSGGILSDEQIHAIREMGKDFSAQQQEIMLQRQEMQRNELTAGESKRFWDDANGKLDEKFFNLIYHDVFFDAQREWLVEMLRSRDARMHGVLGVLFLEKTKDGEPISTAERERMRSVLSKDGKSFRQEIIEIYQESVASQTGNLPASIKKEVQRALGTKPEFLLPNLSLVLDRVNPDASSR